MLPEKNPIDLTMLTVIAAIAILAIVLFLKKRDGKPA